MATFLASLWLRVVRAWCGLAGSETHNGVRVLWGGNVALGMNGGAILITREDGETGFMAVPLVRMM